MVVPKNHYQPISYIPHLANQSLSNRLLDEDKWRSRPMTIGIAAICEWETRQLIVGASDRMLTAGNIEFEPQQTKIANLTSRVIALIAGDAACQMAICADTFNELRDLNNLSVKTVAETFGKHFAKYRKELAELKYLCPLGLDLQSFIQNQKYMLQDTVNDTNEKLLNSRLGIETIIAGLDDNGAAHIYLVKDPGKVICQDAAGFAAIGIGEWHAQSLFMFNKYTRQRLFMEALFLTYAAKRRAEVAPGVGRETDMFIIEHSPMPYTPLHPEVMSKLEETYSEYQTKEDASLNGAMDSIKTYVNEIINKNKQAPDASLPANNPI